MIVTTKFGALFDNHPRCKHKRFLFGITIIDLFASSNLENEARYARLAQTCMLS